MSILRWLARFRDCWRLARKIQRGELIGVRPGLLSATLSVGSTASSAAPAKIVIDTVEVPPDVVESPPGKLWQVRLQRGDIIKVLASFVDPREAMRFWNMHTPARADAGVLQLFDVKNNVVRGTRW